ncbi:endonuclease/exonuclease/phosphatase family protein [Streptococcus sp. ZJ151]|uniref:endonuclease/exonuclease/phosphatase family protein n=1 Tax=Streptococcus jiangjianxini TaxID=3161189 RepID=UPI0032EECBD4
MKLLTLNTHSWREEDMEIKFQGLLSTILEKDYDIICLQEINQLIEADEVELFNYQHLMVNPPIHEDNYALKLVMALKEQGVNYHWSWVYNHIGYDCFHEGVAILSKTPIEALDILASESVDPTDHHTRRALLVRTQIDEKAISVVSLHLSWWEKGFETEWPRLAQALENEHNPLILMGDFNNPTGNEGYQQVINSSLNLQDSHVAAEQSLGDYTILADVDGWEGNELALKVDHAFVDSSFKVKSSTVVFDGNNGPVVSDHFGLEIELI